MSQVVEDTGSERKYPEYIDLFLKYGTGSIHHIVWKILGMPFPKIASKIAGISYKSFLREYRWSLEACPNIIDGILAETNVFGTYDSSVIWTRKISGRQVEILIAGFGADYARRNAVVATVPVNLTGYQAIAGLYIQEYTDANGEKFYIIYDSSRTPPWRLVTDEEKTRAVAKYIKTVIKQELREILKQFEPPVIVEPITWRTYTVYGVTVKDKMFAYHHARKHETRDIEMKDGRMVKPILLLSENKWKYVWNRYTKIGSDYLIYFYTYPENSL